MDIRQIEQKKQEVIERYGPWTAHSIRLADGIYTFDESHWDSRLRRFIQIASDVTKKPLEALRVLDLACLEGHYGIEFALHGANVVATEGRETNLAKVRFAKEVLSLENLDLVLDDVRNLSNEKYGFFDVVLCLGVLYHLDAPDVMNFVQRIFEVCRDVAIIDTHISLDGDDSCAWDGKTYWGGYVQEHDPDASPEEKSEALWHSLDNPRAFVFTRASLCNLLRHVGFTSVYECLNPYEYHNPDWPRNPGGDKHVVWENRITLVAVKGRPQSLISSPITDSSPEIDRPEKPEYLKGHGHMPGKSPKPGKSRGRRSRLAGLVPAPIRGALKRVIRGLWSDRFCI